jgi:putative hydrolase of the HAD superfamily
MKLLIWDFDGTLAFREGLWSSAVAEVARAHIPGCQAVREDFLPHLQWGFPWHSPELPHTQIASAEEWWQHLSPVIAGALVKVTGIPERRAEQLVPVVRATFVDPRHWALFDDVLPCLEALTEARWTHVVLSNHVPELPLLVEALGLTPHMAKVFNSATLGYEKPHPKSFGAVLGAFPDAAATVMVGDNYAVDVQGAKAAGLSAILVRRPNANATAFHESLASLTFELVHGHASV